MLANEGNNRWMKAPSSPRVFVDTVERERDRLLYRIRRGMGPVLLGLCEPEDILQETLIIGLRESSRLPRATAGELCRWLSTIAANRILDLSRRMRERKRPRIATSLPASLLLGVALGELEAVAIARSRTPVVLKAYVERSMASVDALLSDQRLTVVLRDALELPWNTTAFLLDRTIPASRKVHQRARRQLVPTLAARLA